MKSLAWLVVGCGGFLWPVLLGAHRESDVEVSLPRITANSQATSEVGQMDQPDAVLEQVGRCSHQDELGFDRGKMFDEVWALVQEHFFDPAAVGSKWEAARTEFRQLAIDAKTHDDFAEIMREMLRGLKTSHTDYFAATNPRRGQMLGIFQMLVPEDRQDLWLYPSIGIDCEQVEGRWFVRSVFDGTPAAEKGILFGDEIVSIDEQPYQPVESFKGREKVKVAIRRQQNGPIELFDVPVKQFDGRTMFEDALLASAKIIEQNNKAIAYVHVWSYAGLKYQEHLRDLLMFKDLRHADALVLDLRDGWGGASLEYLNLFREPIANLTSKPRDGEPMNFSGVWGKPIVLLTNKRSTSGKELLTYGFKKLGLGQVVGETTAGAVVAGRGFLLSNDDVLYVAVSDVEVDGKRLEGRGVDPDVFVERPLPYAAGADPQLEAALNILSR
jgi:carboxyl-terminal processing protease